MYLSRLSAFLMAKIPFLVVSQCDHMTSSYVDDIYLTLAQDLKNQLPEDCTNTYDICKIVASRLKLVELLHKEVCVSTCSITL